MTQESQGAYVKWEGGSDPLSLSAPLVTPSKKNRVLPGSPVKAKIRPPQSGPNLMYAQGSTVLRQFNFKINMKS